MIEKFCFGCQNMRKLSEGQHIQRGRTKRWICNICLAKKNVSDYAKKTKEMK